MCINSSRVISIENLEHTYGSNKVLHGINLSVDKGKVFGLLGKNGAGKTTTINIMMGFLKPDSGRCLIFDENSYSLSNSTIAKIALLHEGHLAYDFMNIDETEKFYQSFYKAWDKDIYAYLIKKLGLKRSHKVKNMSCGQRSQVTLAVLMAQNSDLLILDDFSMGLDAGYRRLFLDNLNDYVQKREKTVLVTTHIVQDIERFIDEAILIDKGRVITSGKISDLGAGLYGYRVDLDTDIKLLSSYKEVKDISINSRYYEVITYIKPIEADNFFDKALSKKIYYEYFDLTLEDTFIALTGKY